ncbi:MAG: GGDEF domain-containing protein [Lachnospiraceae bacterium]|nr:GGDEF domain-containing protein [Lachnospiraceae bacterium]
MLQIKYGFNTFDELKGVVAEIKENEMYGSARGILLQLNNPKTDADDDLYVEYIRKNLDRACLTGLTCANIADDKYDISHRPIELNVTYFEKTTLLELSFDMSESTGFDAGRIIDSGLFVVPQARCIMLNYSCNSNIVHTFIDEFSHHELPVFGAKAGRSIRALNTAKVYGDKAYSNGIVAIIFISDSLRLFMDNCLGFKEIGLLMRVTGTEGDNTITTIDGKPATEVYHKYLNVTPNKYFVQNVCEFPFIFSKGECSVARVPSGYGENGEIVFTSDVTKGDFFRLSYGDPDNLFHVIENSVMGLKKFEPEAVFLFECGNRVRFLKSHAQREISCFTDYAPFASTAVGYAEMFLVNGGGGVLNSALVAVGFSEKDGNDDIIRPCVTEKEVAFEKEEREYIPFVERILRFLERTSEELQEANNELGKVAYTDRLTKIYNRWELEHKLDETIQICGNGETPAGIIFMDIDHFKNINDTYGHDVGDLVLRATVNLIKDELYEGRIFGRWGGEEFICILPNADAKETAAFAEFIRKKIDENCFVTARHVTMSFGVTQFCPGDDPESFVKRADEAFYEAKETGRNKVVIKI